MAFSKARRLANLMSTASDTVPASKVNTVLADDAVTTAKIADDAVTADQLANSINSAITANTAKVTNATHTGDVTGGTALTIAVDAVDIPMLSATGSPSNTTFLRGDNAWAGVPAGVDIQSSAPSVASEGSLYYNTTTDKLNLSNGTAWLPIDTNAPPTATGGTVTIAAQSGLSTFSYNLGLDFTDEDVDANLAYTLESGTLPAGAVLPTSGNTALTGTATIAATTTYNFIIRATDAKAAFATQAYTQTITALPVGGTITNISGYRVHTFTSSGTFGTSAPMAVQYLVIAGGAGGGQGYQAGAGGAGGYRSNVTGQVSGGGASAEGALTLSAGSTTVTVGAGGAGGPASTAATTVGGYNGANSVLGSITSLGGGGGSSYWNQGTASPNGRAGGSGGGSGNASGSADTGGAGTTGQGYKGGDATGYASPFSGGGGGGAAAVGTNAGSTLGVGGAGASSNINGTATTRAGGGGGGPWVAPGSAGGAGGGGGGSGGNVSTVGTAGTANTGGGGGGSSNQNVVGGAGGSGIVIIRYAV